MPVRAKGKGMPFLFKEPAFLKKYFGGETDAGKLVFAFFGKGG